MQLASSGRFRLHYFCFGSLCGFFIFASSCNGKRFFRCICTKNVLQSLAKTRAARLVSFALFAPYHFAAYKTKGQCKQKQCNTKRQQKQIRNKATLFITIHKSLPKRKRKIKRYVYNITQAHAKNKRYKYNFLLYLNRPHNCKQRKNRNFKQSRKHFCNFKTGRNLVPARNISVFLFLLFRAVYSCNSGGFVYRA